MVEAVGNEIRLGQEVFQIVGQDEGQCLVHFGIVLQEVLAEMAPDDVGVLLFQHQLLLEQQLYILKNIQLKQI